MKIVNINVQEPYYSFILNGQKKVEGRLNKGKFAQIEVGDILIINENEENKFKVIDKKEFSSFEEMIKTVGVENIIPDKEKTEDAVNVYYKFYTADQEKEFGVLGIFLERIEK